MTFIATAVALPGPKRAASLAAFSSARVALRSARTTCAPCAASPSAIASPKPCAAPVTSATRPPTRPGAPSPAAICLR